MAAGIPNYKLEPEVVDKLLDKLSTDDDFRARFAKDHRAALKELGHVPAPNQVAQQSCAEAGQLADKRTIAASRDALRRAMNAGLALNIRMLDDQSSDWAG